MACCLPQATVACRQLAACVSVVGGCAAIAAAGAAPSALLRLLRCCTRSHGALLAAALSAALPLARHPVAGVALVASDAMGVLTEKLQIFRDDKVSTAGTSAVPSQACCAKAKLWECIGCACCAACLTKCVHKSMSANMSIHTHTAHNHDHVAYLYTSLFERADCLHISQTLSLSFRAQVFI